MCHGVHFTDERLREEIARELRRNEEAAEPSDEAPSFLNEERETDVEILTDGGT